MSLRDPDELGRRVGLRLKPFAIVLCGIALLGGPVLAGVHWATGSSDTATILYIFGYDILVTGAGILALFVPGHRTPSGVIAYIVAGVAGMFLIIGSSVSIEYRDTLLRTVILAVVVYLVAAVFAVLFLLRDTAVRTTRRRGVQTTGTVTRAAFDGMTNYVQRQRLTVKFADGQGSERYVKTSKLGGGWSAGDTLQVTFDPQRPGSKRAIIVGN
ncbi:MAG: hypothetical protein JWN80_2803 [Microbacteriaceae bacterium]|nr:hypothetical protein [Microbacteriaceae bacterium]